MSEPNLREFRNVNRITQDTLGEYLGIKKSFVSLIENGKSKLPNEKLSKLINNDMGWDVSMLVNGGIHTTGSGVTNVNVGSTTALEEKIAMLERQLEEEKARSAEYWELLKEAIKESRK